jgi:hypothetical protein
MLISCPECSKDVSDTLATCPHCGFQLEQASNLSAAPATKAKRKKKPATLQYLAFAAIIVALFTPRILVAIPCLMVVACAIVALVRREPRWPLSLLAGVVGFLLIGTSSPSPNKGNEYISKIQVQDWKWAQDDGNYSHVRGRVTNTGDRTASYFSVTAQYKDANGKVLDTAYTNSGQDLGPGISKEFDIMHKTSSEYASVSVAVDKVSVK